MSGWAKTRCDEKISQLCTVHVLLPALQNARVAFIVHVKYEAPMSRGRLDNIEVNAKSTINTWLFWDTKLP